MSEMFHSMNPIIQINNKFEWLQFQINRNSLYTNHKVNKFNPLITPYCTFCTRSEDDKNVELISHLFYDCNVVFDFWIQVRAWLSNIPNEVNIPLDKKAILFGIPNEPDNLIPNFILICGKYYIWKIKKQGNSLFINGFKTYLKFKLDEKKSTLIYEDKERDFVAWLIIYNYL